MRAVFHFTPEDIEQMPIALYAEYVEWGQQHLENLYQRGGSG